MDKITIRSTALIAPLLYLYLNIFLWSKNVSMFSKTELTCSFAAIILASLLCYFIFYAIFSLLNKKIQYTKCLRLGIGIFVAVFIGIISNFLFFRTLFYPYHHFVMYVLMIGIVLIIYYNLTKYFIKFGYVLLLFAICSFGYNAYKNFSAIIEDTDKYLVEFKDKPNIYVICLESFHGARTLENVYSVDINPLTQFLEEKNFTVRENFYSSGGYTLATLTDLFSLGYVNINTFKAGRLDSATAVRLLLAGGPGNNVLKVLKHNGYITNIMIGGYYYFTNKEKYLDYAAIDLFEEGIAYLRPCYAFSKFANASKFPQWGIGNTKELVESQIDEMQKLGKPYFLAVKYEGTNHPITSTYTYKKRTEWINSGLYKHQAEQCIPDIEGIVSVILEKDPNALIVMFGDHGPFTYLGINNSKQLKENNVSLSDFIEDRYNVYGAVKMPDGYEKFSFDDRGIYIHQQNIFIHLFSILAQQPEYTQLQEMPESNFWGKSLVINGIINENVEF